MAESAPFSLKRIETIAETVASYRQLHQNSKLNRYHIAGAAKQTQ